MNRCTKSILPEDYPAIVFDNKGVCQYCAEHKEIDYVGLQPLVGEIRTHNEHKKNRNKEYDCLLGFSGGRDSTYLLYILRKELGLSVLCYSADHGYVPDQTKSNMKHVTEILNSKLIIEKHDYLQKSLKHAISTWIHRPSIPMIETFCIGCKFGVLNGVVKYAKSKKIPVVIWGETPFEFPHYRFNFFKKNPNSGKYTMILGYLSCVVKNPRWILSPAFINMQLKDFLFFFYMDNIFKNAGLVRLEPLVKNLRYKEKVVMSKLTRDLGWSRNPNTESSWRGDCTIALLKLYTYYEILGFNDKVVNLSYLVRDQQITREEALERLKEEEKIPDKIIEDILDGLGLDFSDFKGAVRKARKNYSMGIIR